MTATALIIHSPSLTQTQMALITQTLGHPPEPVDQHHRVTLPADHAMAQDQATLETQLHQLREQLQIDINRLPSDFDPTQTQLMISDMDSTLIGIECVDEIADMLSIKPQVAAITEAAMRGELDFEQSLIQRVALLKGLAVDQLDKVFNERLVLNPGARTWIAGLKQRQIQFALVSGGFTFFTERLKQQLELDHALANQLDIVDQTLTGQLTGAIVGAQAKAQFLQDLCQTHGFDCAHTIAIGDGANDLEMMQTAGLSIAYHAKPKVQAHADICINHGGLDKVLDLLPANTTR